MILLYFTKLYNKMTTLNIYTDGSCINGKGGYGFVIHTEFQLKPWLNSHPTDYKYSGYVPIEPSTNNIAELYAIWKALHELQYIDPVNQINKYIIYSDSNYAIKCLTEWYHKWMKNGWKNANGKPVKNETLIRIILETMTSF